MEQKHKTDKTISTEGNLINDEIPKVKKEKMGIIKKHVLPAGLAKGMKFSVHNTHYLCTDVKEDGTPTLKIIKE